MKAYITLTLKPVAGLNSVVRTLFNICKLIFRITLLAIGHRLPIKLNRLKLVKLFNQFLTIRLKLNWLLMSMITR